MSGSPVWSYHHSSTTAMATSGPFVIISVSIFWAWLSMILAQWWPPCPSPTNIAIISWSYLRHGVQSCSEHNCKRPQQFLILKWQEQKQDVSSSTHTQPAARHPWQRATESPNDIAEGVLWSEIVFRNETDHWWELDCTLEKKEEEKIRQKDRPHGKAVASAQTRMWASAQQCEE